MSLFFYFLFFFNKVRLVSHPRHTASQVSLKFTITITKYRILFHQPAFARDSRGCRQSGRSHSDDGVPTMISRTFPFSRTASFPRESTLTRRHSTNYGLHCHNRKIAHCDTRARHSSSRTILIAPHWRFSFLPSFLPTFFSLVRPPYVVSLLALLTKHADLSNAADSEIAAGYSDLFLADVTVQVQVYLVLIHGAV